MAPSSESGAFFKISSQIPHGMFHCIWKCHLVCKNSISSINFGFSIFNPSTTTRGKVPKNQFLGKTLSLVNNRSKFNLDSILGHIILQLSISFEISILSNIGIPNFLQNTRTMFFYCSLFLE